MPHSSPIKSILCVFHRNDVTMNSMASQITSFTIVCSTVYSDADQRIHQRSASLAFVQGIHRWPVNSPHKWPVTRKMFPFDDVIMYNMVNVFPNSPWCRMQYDMIFGHVILWVNNVIYIYDLTMSCWALRAISVRLMTSQYKDIVNHTQKWKPVNCMFCIYGLKTLCEILEVPFEISEKIWAHTPQNMHFMWCWKFDYDIDWTRYVGHRPSRGMTATTSVILVWSDVKC